MDRCLIANSRASAVRRFEHQLDRLAAKHSCKLYWPHEQGGIEQCAHRALQSGCRRLILAGGDGTVYRVLNAIAPNFDVELAILPFGTGNDLARSLDVQVEQLHSAMHTAFGDRVEPIDLIKIQTSEESTAEGESKPTYCVNVANGGFGGRVAIDVASSDKKRWGRMAYWMTSVSQLVNVEQFEVRLEMDNECIEMPTFGVAVANGRYVGGGFPIAPYALLNDGLMDVTTIPVLPTMELMAAGMNYLLTLDHSSDGVRTHRVKRLHFTSAPAMPFSVDGEPIRPFDATFEVLPKALRVVTGVSPVGLLGGDEALDEDHPMPIPRLLV